MSAPAVSAPVARRRPAVIIVAIVLMVITAIVNVLPGDETPPLAILLVSIIDSVLLIGAVVGLWMCRRWGFILGVVALVINLLLSIVALVFGPEEIRVIVAVGIAVCVAILVLLALPAARRAYH